MKKTVSVIVVIMMLCLCACGTPKSVPPDNAVATEKDVKRPDLDLTTLSSTMVYSEVFNIMQDPASYAGKTIKITGIYVPIKNDDGTVAYPACLIQDATACCQQGMEFVTENGEYPSEGQKMTVQGRFMAYTDSLDGQTYYHLENATVL